MRSFARTTATFVNRAGPLTWTGESYPTSESPFDSRSHVIAQFLCSLQRSLNPHNLYLAGRDLSGNFALTSHSHQAALVAGGRSPGGPHRIRRLGVRLSATVGFIGQRRLVFVQRFVQPSSPCRARAKTLGRNEKLPMSPENSRKWRSNFWNADGCGTPQTRLEFDGMVPKAKSSTRLPQSFVTTGNPDRSSASAR
jgi:hypothetical protein